MTAVDTPAPGLVEAWLDNDALVGDKRILGAYAWRDNAELITAVARLHIVPRFGQDPHVVDATFGEGKWWTRWRPRRLVPHDRYKVDGVDYRALPEADDTYEVGTLDVPYVAIGGRETSTIHQFNHAYGLVDAPKNPAGVQADLQAGLAEVARVVAPKGLVLVKCMPYVSSGRVFDGDKRTWQFATQELGLRLVDEFIHLAKAPRAQPKGRSRKARRGEVPDFVTEEGEGRMWTVQQHAVNNRSTLYVFGVPPRRRRKQ